MNGFGNKFARALFIAFLASELWAAPANPTPFTVDNAGDSLTLRKGGDEHYRYTLTLDGYLVIRGADGVYRYATEEGTAGKFKAKNAGLRSDAEKSYLNGLDREKVRKAHFEKNPDRVPFPADMEREGRSPWVPTKDTSSSADPRLKLPPASGHVKGTNRFPVLLVESPDAENCDSSAFYAQANEAGYSKSGHIGSVRDYYVSQSGGIFAPTFDVYPVRVGNSLSSYKKKEGRLVKEAVEALLSKFPNFDAKIYDADNDGEVDALAVMYAGTEDAADDLGGFAYMLQYNSSTNDGVGRQNAGNGKNFNRYFILQQMDSQTKMTPIAQFVHEFSHTMGLKDHYCVYGGNCYNDYTDSVYQAPGAHAWDVMGTGMYNGPVQGATPIGYSAFEKAFMGWISYRTLETSDAITVLSPFGETDEAYKVPVEGNADEWFVLENRQKSGWDANLPYHGMLIWHIDYDATAWSKDALNDVAAHQRVDVVEAGNLKINTYRDGFFHSFSRSYLNDDPYPGSQNVTAFSFTAWNGKALGVNLYGIREEDGKICFATREGVAVNECTVEVSSSSFAESSSSSFVSSSSSAESSSSQGESLSSSSVPAAIANVQNFKNSIELYGTVLSVRTGISGRKTVRVYDLSGKEILRQSFDGFSASLDLRKFSGKMLVVKISARGRAPELKRVVVN